LSPGPYRSGEPSESPVMLARAKGRLAFVVDSRLWWISVIPLVLCLALAAAVLLSNFLSPYERDNGAALILAAIGAICAVLGAIPTVITCRRYRPANESLLAESTDPVPEDDRVELEFRPEVLRRRLERYQRDGVSGLRASEAEVLLHRTRSKGSKTFSGSVLRGSRIVRVTRDGLLVGNFRRALRLHPWDDVVCAHVVGPYAGQPAIIQVELADGSAIDVDLPFGRPSADIAQLLAPRWFPYGAEQERSVLDLAGETTVAQRRPADRRVRTGPKRLPRPVDTHREEELADETVVGDGTQPRGKTAQS
jgi:hypothetical protein